MTRQIAPFPMTFSDRQGNSPTASFIKCDFSYSCAVVDTISTDWSVTQSLQGDIS